MKLMLTCIKTFLQGKEKDQRVNQFIRIFVTSIDVVCVEDKSDMIPIYIYSPPNKTENLPCFIYIHGGGNSCRSNF